MNDSTISENTASKNSGPLITIIEDDLDHSKILEEHLASIGFNVSTVYNPVKALNHIKKNNPDIILVAIQMKELRGERVIKVLRKYGITIPVIVISSEINTEMILALKSLSVKGLLIKPVDLDKLESKINSLLSSNKKSKPNNRTSSLTSVNRNNVKPTLLVISEFENIKEDPYTIIPRNVFEKQGFRIISKTNYQDSIESLKKAKNNIKVVLVNATNEAHTKTTAKLLNIIVLKSKIPVYFIADEFSHDLQGTLNKLGFANLISLQETPPKDIIAIFKPLFSKTTTKSTIPTTTNQRLSIMKNLKAIKSLPPMPDIYNKIEKLASDPNATSTDYSKVLELDTDITARLLRMSNSALFSFKREIRSVKDAVTLMGIREIVSLVRLSCITGFLNVTPAIESTVKKIWEHSATCAVASKLVYNKTDICEDTLHEDTLFTSSIIHDIGKIVLWKFFPNIYSSFILNPEIGSHPSESEEKKFIGISHCEVGKVLAEHWKLPESLTDVIALHHRPSLKPDSDILKVIHISNIISNITMDIIQEDQELGNDPGLEKIGFTEEKIRELANDLSPEIKKQSALVLRMITS